MRGAAHVRIAGDGPRALPVDIRSEPPFAIRRSGSRVLLVSSAAAPVGGDDLALEIDVEPGAHADLGTVAATMVWPSPTPALSVMTTTVRVGAGAHVLWRPYPMVSVAGSEHLAATTVQLAADATATRVSMVAAIAASDWLSGLPSGLVFWTGTRNGTRHTACRHDVTARFESATDRRLRDCLSVISVHQNCSPRARAQSPGSERATACTLLNDCKSQAAAIGPHHLSNAPDHAPDDTWRPRNCCAFRHRDR